MWNVSLLSKALCLLFVLAAATDPARAFDGCRAADVNDNGYVSYLDLSLIAPQGVPSPRLDLDGGGAIDEVDIRMAYGFIYQTCSGCTADLDGSGQVDAADRALLEAAYGRDCRLDMDRNGTVDDDNDLAIFVLYFQSLPSPAKERADFDGNGVVNLVDVHRLLPTIGNDCTPDLNKDGAVNTNDLWFLLASWGTCPLTP